ncbi:MAG TPA: NADPH-dependent F420 reductase [Methanomicrobiales archaeon]|nr:NADPH-dependent F420 reductase [Methanomicrobiales archaeon]
MRVGIVGGTGDIGEGMALRISQVHEVILGSREVEKACTASTTCHLTLDEKGLPCTCSGVSNQDAVTGADLVILAIPFQHVQGTLGTLTGLEGKVVISPVNPLARKEAFLFTPPPEGSAALLIQKLLPRSKVCAAFNNIAAGSWKALDAPFTHSVAVCGDDPAAKELVKGFVAGIPGLTPFDAGPLAVSPMVEAITPLLLNIARFQKMRDVGIRFS